MLGFFVIKTVQNREVLNQLFDVGTEVGSAGGARQYVTSPEVHETILAEGMATG